jgi:hypothetical protein
MSSDAVVSRHALGMPPGSVRAVLALMVVGLVCALMLIHSDKPLPIPAYLIYLLFLVLGHYFAARGSSRGEVDAWNRQPLNLPRGCIRLVLLASLLGTLIYKLYSDSAGFEAQWLASVTSLKEVPMLPVVILCGFFVGTLLRMVIGRQPPAWYQDMEAWVALIAVLLMSIATLIHLVISPSLESPILSMPEWECILSGVVAFYFGARS